MEPIPESETPGHPPAPATMPAPAVSIEDRLDIMKKEIDEIQIAMAAKSKPWYKNLATWLSLIALAFSVGSTTFTFARNYYADIQSSRKELRGLLQRLSALPKENLEAMQKYEAKPGLAWQISSMIGQENVIVGRSAAEIARQLPKKYVSAAECQAIALALQSGYDLDSADEFLSRALQTNPDFNTELAALRMSASLQLLRRGPEAGRVQYERALGIFERRPNSDKFVREMTAVQTYINWAYAEAPYSYADAMKRIDEAQKIVDAQDPSPGHDMLLKQVREAKSVITLGRVPAPTLPPPTFGVAPVTLPAS